MRLIANLLEYNPAYNIRSFYESYIVIGLTLHTYGTTVGLFYSKLQQV